MYEIDLELGYRHLLDLAKTCFQSEGKFDIYCFWDNVKEFISKVGTKDFTKRIKTISQSWKSEEKKLLEKVLNKLKVPEKPTDLPLRVPIQDAYNITGIGCVPVGKIETGILKIGQKVIAVPGREGTGISGEVKSIEMHHHRRRPRQNSLVVLSARGHWQGPRLGHLAAGRPGLRLAFPRRPARPRVGQRCRRCEREAQRVVGRSENILAPRGRLSQHREPASFYLPASDEAEWVRSWSRSTKRHDPVRHRRSWRASCRCPIGTASCRERR